MILDKLFAASPEVRSSVSDKRLGPDGKTYKSNVKVDGNCGWNLRDVADRARASGGKFSGEVVLSETTAGKTVLRKSTEATGQLAFESVMAFAADETESEPGTDSAPKRNGKHVVA